ncbi:sensor histidine kinase [Desulfonatronum lacustre]|uniref:sensor histidine kinase n=1 Tax=Desulfonatronum lacustre TaxID=66849 RepID=UPI000A0521B0|nr:PAS domain S-box protein [Desulfonatronum lacustre]
MPVNEKPSVASEVAGPPGPNVEELFSDGPVVLFVWKPKPGWPVEYVSRNVAGLIGYSPTEILSPAFYFIDLLHPDDLQRTANDIHNHLKNNASQFEQFYRLRHKDGPYRWIHDYTRPVYNHSGQIVRIQGYLLDQTPRKQAELALAENARQTQAILDNVIDGIITIDENRVVTSFNRAAERIFEYSAQEVLGRNVNMLMPEPYHSEHEGYVNNYLQTGVTKIIGIGREVEARRKSGRTFPMELSVSEISHNGKRVFIGMVRDITERKRMERMKNEFVATVSHELRTPLTSISGPISLLLGGALGELPESARKMLEVAHKNSLRLANLINDLLDMEKIAAGKMPFELSTQEVMPMVEQAVHLSQPHAAQYQVKLSLVERADGVQVRVDGQRLQQILTNFLSNAAKFSPKDGSVQVGVKKLDGQVRIRVSDDGPGIPTEFRSRIFQKFSQADSSDTRQKGGTGLGLAIAKELAEKMGGRVDFESEHGQGSIFYVDLPLVATKAERVVDDFRHSES